MRRRRIVWILAVLGLVALGCGGSKPSRFYVLRTTVEPAQPGAVASLPDASVALDPVSIPEYLDRPQIVTRTGETELVVDEFNRWGGSLKANVTDVLAENLSSLLGTDDVLTPPWSSSRTADYRVAIHIREFELTDEERAVMQATWYISAGGGPMSNATTARFEQPTGVDPKEKGYSERVDAMSLLLGELSRRIAADIEQIAAQSAR